MARTKIVDEKDAGITAQGYNERTDLVILPMEARNAFFNHKQVFQDMHVPGGVGADLCKEEEGKHKGPCLLLGSGPGTDDIMPYLKDWKGGIMTSISQATTCVYYGNEPDFIVALDPRHRWETLSQVDTWKGKRSKLLLTPCMHPHLVANWPLKKLYYRVIDQNIDFYRDILPAGYDFIHSYLYIFAHTLAAQVSFAHMMGYDPLILVGCEFGGSRYMRWYYDQEQKVETKHGRTRVVKGKWRHEKPHGKLEVRKEMQVRARNGVITSRLQLFYKRSLFCVIRLDKCNIVNCSRPKESIIDEFPFITFQEALKRQETGYKDLYYTQKQIKDVTEQYLARGNQWVLVIEEQPTEELRFYEQKDIGALGAYLAGLRANGVPVNVEKNMRRINRLKKFAEENP